MYKPYTKKSFEFLLRKNAIENKLGFMTEIELKNSVYDVWEYVYSLSTRNKSVDILIFSSVDKRTNKTRVKGADCVRLVLRWKTKNGFIYKRIGKHYRVETLFDNLTKTIQKVQSSVFNLNGKEFQKEIA